ncbi:MAG: hypothetical protein QNL85_05300 [Euryarchaeota archaeon]
MWGTLGVISLILLLLLGVWHSFTSGVLREMIEFAKLPILIDRDMFDGETKTFVLQRNGKEKALKIKKINDALNAITSSRISSGSISFDPKREKGLYLEFSMWESGGVGLMTIIEKNGDKIIKEDEYNLEEKGLGPAIYKIKDLIERMSSPSSVWDEVSLDKK